MLWFDEKSISRWYILISRKLYWIFVHKYKDKMDAARCEFPKGIQIIQTTVSVNVYNWSDEGPKEVFIKYISSLSSSGHKNLFRKKKCFPLYQLKLANLRCFFAKFNSSIFKEKIQSYLNEYLQKTNIVIHSFIG